MVAHEPRASVTRKGAASTARATAGSNVCSRPSSSDEMWVESDRCRPARRCGQQPSCRQHENARGYWLSRRYGARLPPHLNGERSRRRPITTSPGRRRLGLGLSQVAATNDPHRSRVTVGRRTWLSQATTKMHGAMLKQIRGEQSKGDTGSRAVGCHDPSVPLLPTSTETVAASTALPNGSGDWQAHEHSAQLSNQLQLSNPRNREK